MSNSWVSVRKVLLTMLCALGIGAIIILLIGENPLKAYAALLEGAFVGKLALGTTLSSFTPLMLTTVAFAVAAKAGAFNVGVEGEVFLGGVAAAYVGANWTFLPAPLLIVTCFLVAVIVGAIWAYIPGVLRAYYNVNEVCTTILLNTVALYITSYLVSGPMSAGGTVPQSNPVAVSLPRFMRPSNVNIGLFLAIIVVLLIIFMIRKTSFGYHLTAVGNNPLNAEYVGINPRKVFTRSMMLSGAIGGFAGCIEVLGVHGCFVNNFATGLGINGMLASLIVKNNIILGPIMAFFLSILKSGAMGMQQSTNVPKSIIDTITAVFIIMACMELLFRFVKKRKKNNRLSKDNKGEEVQV